MHVLLSITFHLFNKTSCCCIFLFVLLCASPSCHHAAAHNFLLLHCLCNLHCRCLLFHHTVVCPYSWHFILYKKITQAAPFSHAPLLHTILVFIFFTQYTTVQFLWLSAATHILIHPVCIKNLLSLFFFMHFFACCIA